MLYLILFLFALSVGLGVYVASEVFAGPNRALSRQLGLVEQLSRGVSGVGAAGANRSRASRVADLLGRIGRLLQRRESRATTIRDLLIQAGFRRQEALSVFWGTRMAAMVGLPLVVALFALLSGVSAGGVFMALLWALIVAWLLPKVYLRTLAASRRRDIDRNLPDALDLLVVCIEAGLGLNQALARMADEIRHFSPATSDEFVLVNLEMRAGVPRVDAMRALGDRMGVADLRGLATMLIQADRFGTSIAQALRVHAETAREKRRQRAEEAAAKTTVKLIFPIVLCVFPTVFVIVLAPAVIGFLRTMADM